MMSLAQDQVLREPLVYLGLVELSPSSLQVHRRQFFHRGPHCSPIFMASEPHMTTEIISVQCWIWFEPPLKLLMPDWKTHFYQFLSDHSPYSGPSQYAMKSYYDWDSRDLAKQIRGRSPLFLGFRVDFQSKKSYLRSHVRFTLGSHLVHGRSTTKYCISLLPEIV